MTRYIKGKDGKLAGSIGDGKHEVPTSTPPGQHAAPQPVTDLADDIEALYARFGARPVTVDSAATRTPAAVPTYDTVVQVPATTFRGIYTEYLADVDQLEYDDLDDMTGPYDWATLEVSIIKDGIREPIEIGVDEDGQPYVINGCHRAVIAYRLNLPVIPVIYRRH